MGNVAHTLKTVAIVDTTGFEDGTKRIRREAKRTEKSVFEVGAAGAKAAAVGGAAFSSFGAGISIATSSAEGLEGALASASGSVVAAFGAGGVAGGALAVAALSIGSMVKGLDLFGTKAEEIIKKARMARQEERDAKLSEVEKLRRERELAENAKLAASMGVDPKDFQQRRDFATRIAEEQRRLARSEGAIPRIEGLIQNRKILDDLERRTGARFEGESVASLQDKLRQEKFRAQAAREIIFELRSALERMGTAPGAPGFPNPGSIDFIRGSRRSLEGFAGGASGAAIRILEKIEGNTRGGPKASR